MKKIIVATFLITLFSLVITSAVKVREGLKLTTYSVNFSKFKNLSDHINQSKKVSINKSKEESMNKQELSLSAPIKRKVVKEERISKTNWAGLFNSISIKEEVKIEIAKVENPVIKKVEKIESLPILKEEVIEDRISTALSATEKSIVPEVKKEIVRNNSNDEIEFYDYSSTPTEEQKKSPLTKKIESYNRVLKKIKKQSLNLANMKFKKPRKKVVSKLKHNEQEVDSNGFLPQGLEETKESAFLADNEKDRKINNQVIDPKVVNSKTYESSYTISAKTVDMDRMNEKELEGFRLQFLDSDLETVYDDENGYINVESKLNSQMMIRRAELTSIDHYPTIIDGVLENGETAITVPLIKRREFDNLLSRSKIKGLGGHVLVELDEKTEDVEIGSSTNYETKVYLDRNYKVVNREDSDFYYVMFIGVEPGNAVIYFRTLTNQTISKIIHVADESIYYEPNYYMEVVNDEYSIFEEGLLSRDTTALHVNTKEIQNFSSEYKIENLAFNRLGLKKAIYPMGTRKYQEFKHLDESIFVGRWDQNYIDLPSEEYARFVLSQFDQSSVDGRCLVQINITKPAKSLSYNGIAKRGMSVKSLILDQDGQFYDELSDKSRKIFVLGENQGIINVKVEYTDNSIDTLQSYCSQDTYLVEQL